MFMTELFFIMKKKSFIFIICSFLVLFALGEIVSRVFLGLGDPPLSVAHPTIEYMFAPSAEYRRFGNDFKTNSYSMRSDEFPVEKEEHELRILILGDSVPNGGNLTDQTELTSERLKLALNERLHRQVTVGNISAGTWSPPNMLAYVKEYGTFSADAAFIVLNKGDFFDFPTFAALNPKTHPTKKPMSAFVELITRYGFLRLESLFSKPRVVAQSEKDPNRPSCLPELQSLMETFQAAGTKVYLLYHPSMDEIDVEGAFQPKGGYPYLLDFCQLIDVPLYSMASSYGKSVRAGNYPFRDHYHPNPLGQELIFEEMMRILKNEGCFNDWIEK